MGLASGTLASRREFFRLGLAARPRVADGAWLSARGREHDVATSGALALEGQTPALTAIRLNSNENPVGPSAKAIEAIVASLPRAARYPDKALVTDQMLTAAIAAQWGVVNANVVWSAGSAELLAAAVRAFTSPAKPLVTAWPSFETPHTMAERMGTPVIEVALDSGLGLDIAKMIDAAKGAGLVFFCNPNNPTGTVHGADAVLEFIARVHSSSPDTVVLIDEAYHDYVTDPSYQTAARHALDTPRVLVTRTFSKAHGMAGVRVGYAIGQPATISALARYRNPLGMSVPGAAAAVASLADTAHIAAERARNTQVREFTVQALAKLGIAVVPSNANFVFARIDRPAAAFRDACARAGVLVGRDFPPYQNTHCRVSIGTMDEMTKALAVFAKALQA
jgi:histidinol-phosphate aminotransferase